MSKVNSAISRCPLIIIANFLGVSAGWYSSEDISGYQSAKCLGDECGFWYDKDEQCSIVAIAKAVYDR